MKNGVNLPVSHESDYSPINSSKWIVGNRFEAKQDGSTLLAATHNLYNGNIGSMVNALYNDAGGVRALGNSYEYDQLNRLTVSKTFDNIIIGSNAWSTGTYNGMFENKFGYDANGNILTQLRKSELGTSTIDNLTYNYRRAANGQLLQNRLYHVNDAVAASAFPDDVDDMGAFTSDALLIESDNNYAYDALGQLIKDEQENISEIVWRNDGRIARIQRGSPGTQQSLIFAYNPSGERISKKILDHDDVWIETTYYIRDASGNVMATYLNKNNSGSETFDLTERYIYGVSRLGVLKEPVSMLSVSGETAFHYTRPGYKHYELANHLGNVMTTITAQKVPLHSGSTLTGYTPQVIKSYDYSPFGVTRLEYDVTERLTGANGVDDDSRYGFNGQEKDDEIKGSGNSINYLARIYDPRLGKFLSVDPLTKKFPMLTPYQFASNTPIQAIDLDGLEGLIVVKMDKPPTNFNKAVFAKELQQRLIESGAHKDTRVVFENTKAYNDIGAWNRFWDYESDQSAIIKIRDMNIVRDAGHTDAGGYGEDGQVVIYRGLVGIKNNAAKDRELPTSTYVNVALHEIGHAVYDFFGKEKTDIQNGLGHDAKGDSKTGTDIMDYDAAFKKDAGFSDEQKEVIKEKAGEDEE